MKFCNAYFKKQILGALKIAVSVSSFFGVFIALIPFGFWWINIIIIGSVFLVLFCGLTLFFMNKKTRKVFSLNNVSFNIIYGDILNIKMNNDKKPIVVIPVNSAFDYIVEDNLDVKNPIISSKSLHGKWIKKIANDEINKIERLKMDINKGIESSCLVETNNLVNKRGNTKMYELGSAIFIERDDCTYMLFALTDFDENNHVIERTVSTYSNLINKFVAEIDRCQGRNVYVPIMGVGLSLFGLDYKRALEIMKTSIINHKNTLRSSVNIVIYDGDKDKVSIFD